MTERFRFSTSWGAEVEEGGARFRIWAPAEQRMSLQAAPSGAVIPMVPAGDGWFELHTDAVPVGGGYSFLLANGLTVNDPAARAQVAGVHGSSRLVDPESYRWRTGDWRGRPWEETVFYELHVGAFSPEGTFDGVLSRLDYLAGIGVTCIELLPVAQFGGTRGWGYDGVLLYAPHVAYGGPDKLKALIDAAHERELMMFLDVVYNHFGPDGSYIGSYAPEMFHPEHHTPWGAAIAYEKKPVRDFFIENALYWLEEYRFDGLRLDAVDHIDSQSDEPLLEEIGQAVRSRITDRHVHLTTEDDRNITRLHERDAEGRVKLYSGEWNDDVHHAFHVIATGEKEGYYADFAMSPAEQLAKALASGFIFQGEPSPFRDGKLRGVSSAHLPPSAFVNFLQNHDQIGNRAFNERLTVLSDPPVLEALTAILLLSPQIPLLFMGEEYGETNPFSFFTDFYGELGNLVREGRRREFGKWPAFSHEDNYSKIADPNAETTLAMSRLDWRRLSDPAHARRLAYVSGLLHTRQREIVPLAKQIGGDAGAFAMVGDHAFKVRWTTRSGGFLALAANLGPSPVASDEAVPRGARVLFSYPSESDQTLDWAELPPNAVVVARDA